MTKRIFRSAFLVAVLVLLASFALIFGVLYEYNARAQFQMLSTQASLASQGVSNEGMAYFDGLDTTGYRLTWISGDGTVLFDSRADASTMETHLDREEIQEALAGGRVSVTQSSVLALILGLLQPTLVVIGIALLLSVLLAGRLSRRIVRPLNDLNLDEPLENDVYEELAPLLTRIERQQRRIQSQMEELRHRRDEFSAITGSMSEGLVLLNEKGVVVSINRSASRLFGSDGNLIGRDMLTVDRSRAMRDLIAGAREGRHVETYKDFGSGRYQMNASPILSGGAPAGIVILAFEVTEKMLAEKQRREFSANVSHELKTPLQSILGSAELIENGLVKPEDMPRFVGRIRSEAGRLMALIDDVIRLSQLDEGAVGLPRESVDLAQLTREAADSLSEAAAARGVRLETHGQGVVVNGVRRLLWEIVYNLCENAIKYNVENGSVDVKVEANAAGEVTLTVADTGIGIAPEHHSRVFERFYRVDKSHSRETGGTGLGLSIVKHAAAVLGASIDLKSREGAGTTVSVRFPADR
jgi:two-component system phosphate regulon sensor histidine kinase PhoR